MHNTNAHHTSQVSSTIDHPRWRSTIATLRATKGATTSERRRRACDGRFGRSFIPPSVCVREAGVIEAKRVQERRLQVGNAHTIHGGLVSEIVCLSMDKAALESA